MSAPGRHIIYPEKETPEIRELATRLDELLGDGDAGGVGHVVFFDGQLPVFAIPVAPDPAATALTLPPGDGDAAAVHMRTGRQLYHLLTGLEPELTALRSGPLIRTVLRSPVGAVFFYMVDTGVYLYGTTAHPDHIDAVDRRLADAVNGIRDLVHLQRLNYGSFLSSGRPSTGRLPTPPYGTAVLPSREPDGERDPGEDTATELLLSAALAPDGLHYVAYYRDNRLAARQDILDHPALTPFFALATTSRDSRRAQYHTIGHLLPSVVRRLNSTLSAVAGGHLLRLVLDVEQGAISYHALPDKQFLVGVTLDQERVEDADLALARLGRALGAG